MRLYQALMHHCKLNKARARAGQAFSQLRRQVQTTIRRSFGAMRGQSSHPKFEFWHHVLGKVLEGLGLNQFVASLAMYASCLVVYGMHSENPNAVLAFYLIFLSLGSHLAVLFVVPRPNKESAFYRVCAQTLFYPAVVLTIYPTWASSFTGFAWLCYVCSLGPPLVFASLISLPAFSNRSLNLWPLEDFIGPGTWTQLIQSIIGLVVCRITSGMYLYLAVDLKFGRQTPKSVCDLNSAEEKQWTLGQILSLFMLLVLVLPTFDAYWGKLQSYAQ